MSETVPRDEFTMPPPDIGPGFFDGLPKEMGVTEQEVRGDDIRALLIEQIRWHRQSIDRCFILLCKQPQIPIRIRTPRDEAGGGETF